MSARFFVFKSSDFTAFIGFKEQGDEQTWHGSAISQISAEIVKQSRKNLLIVARLRTTSYARTECILLICHDHNGRELIILCDESDEATDSRLSPKHSDETYSPSEMKTNNDRLYNPPRW